MKYIVLEDFTDVKDKRKIYRKGDRYPTPVNKKVDQKRLDELSSTKNRLGAPLIKKVGEDLDGPEETEVKPEKKKATRKKATQVATKETEVKNDEQEQG